MTLISYSLGPYYSPKAVVIFKLTKYTSQWFQRQLLYTVYFTDYTTYL